MTLRSMWERLKDYLFFIPILFIIGAGLLAWGANRLDATTDLEEIRYLLPTSVAGARTLLATVAGATITVAAMVFSITLVSVQLFASQYSPRVLHGFLRDRFQQVIVGIVVGTFTFSLIALATLGGGRLEGDGVAASWAATISAVLAIATVLAIVAFVDQIARRIRVDDTIRRLADATTESMKRALDVGSDSAELAALQLGDETTTHPVRATTTGWVLYVDYDALLEVLPQGSLLHISQPVGSYVVEGDELGKVWSPDGDAAPVAERALEGIGVGPTRTVEQDPGFGLRQLTDIALRALSPGINDPATAADVVRQLAEPLRIALLGPGRRAVFRNTQGARVVVDPMPDRGDYLRAVFSEIRLVAGSQPHVLQAIAETLGSLRAQVAAAGLDARIPLLEEQISLLRAEVERSPVPPPDLARVRASLDDLADSPSSDAQPRV